MKKIFSKIKLTLYFTIILVVLFFLAISVNKPVLADCVDPVGAFGYTYLDLNNNGYQDTGENPINIGPVQINTAIWSVTTDASGNYVSPEWCQGMIQFINTVIPGSSGYFKTSPTNFRSGGAPRQGGGDQGGLVSFGVYNGSPTIPAPIGTGTPTCTLSNQPVIDLSWTVAPNTTSYQLFRNGGLKYSGALSTFRDGTNSSDLLASNTAYTYQIFAFNSNGSTSSEQFTVTSPTCTTTLNITQSGALSSPAPAGATFDKSGNQSTQGGINYFNPMNIQLVTSPSNPILAQYYVAFYDKTSGTLISDNINFLTLVQNRLKTSAGGDPKNGFLLAYVSSCPVTPPAGAVTPCSASTYYVYDPVAATPWATIPSLGKDVCIITGTCPNLPTNPLIYTASKKVLGDPDSDPKWIMTYYPQFNSKDMYTAVYIVDTSGIANLISNITPTP